MKKIVIIALTSILFAAVAIVACSTAKENPKPLIVNPEEQKEDKGGGESGTYKEPVVGSVMTAWVKGFLDIHFINTTAGECIFLTFPDGTQMLLDAAGSTQVTGVVSGTIENTGIRKRWDPTATKTLYGEFIADYIKKCMAWTGNETIDYALNSHLHADHFGGCDNLPVSVNSNTYVQSSMAYILDNFKVGLMMDRGYPAYDYPFDEMTYGNDHLRNYVKAVRWHVANKGLKVEKFKAGTDKQIVLKKDAASYPTFSVRNLAVNGDIWTGTGESVTSTFPKASEIASSSAGNCPPENAMSAMIKVNYGKFGFASFGDAQYSGMGTYLWKDIETPVSKVCGEAEVMKADHHGSSNTNGVKFYCSAFKCYANGLTFVNPQCWIVNGWCDAHPRQDTFENVVTNLNTDAYFTNTCAAMKKYPSYGSKMKAGDGHIVIRVRPGGDSYNVYVLTDSDRKMTVKYASPVYNCR